MSFVAAHALLWEHFRAPFFLALLLGLSLPVAGAMLVARRASLFAVALPQAAYAGAAAGLFFHPFFHAAHDVDSDGPPTLVLKAGALILTALAAGWIARPGVGLRAKDGGTRAGIALVILTALAEVFRSLSPFGERRLEPLLHGEAVAVRVEEAWLAGVVATLAAIGLVLGRKTLDFAAAEPGAARAIGVRTDRAAIAFFGATALMVAVATPVTGPLLVLAGLLAGPSLLNGRIGSVGLLIACSSGAGLVGAYVGACGSIAAETPFGASIALGITAIAFLTSVLIRLGGKLRAEARPEP